MRLTLAEITTACGARPTGVFAPDIAAIGAGMDSRTVSPGSLFVCIKGERSDGHDFAKSAASSGAAAVLAQRELPEAAGLVPVLVVPDTVKALGKVAAFWRNKAKTRVIGVTGTAGKTTVKEMLLAILSRRFAVCGTKGNFNNQIGLPLTMLNCPAKARVWVLEIGISRPGDMEELGEIARPDLAVITNIGPAHLEGLGGIEGVAKAKAALAGYCAEGGTALASPDYPLLWEALPKRCIDPVAFSGRDPSARFHAAYLGANCTGGRFTLTADGETRTMTLPFFGGHAAENLACAAGAAILSGASIDDVAAGLSGLEIPGGRYKAVCLGGLTLIDDTYNANPLSMARSIEAASAQAGDAPLVLILGEMRELGAQAAERHRELGAKAASAGATAVFFHGGHADDLAAGLAEAGFAGVFTRIDDPGSFAAAFTALGLSTATALFKGSRSTGMERFFAALAGAKGGRP